ncbi:unconventional myosin-IXa-like isoform X6 [Mytilus californianus]|uniref:unconventional myosin-IXa-like isoform X6 n=1 Tax=Mytilus californianus TaxID=6549 RepID=UPI002246080C|nr:unconventional myosin-IXa-like isoform X6 [Mytilus californianus]
MAASKKGSVRIVRRMSMETYMVRVYAGQLCTDEYTSIEAEKTTCSADIVAAACLKLRLGDPNNYELAEVFSSSGQLCKERRLEPSETPVRIQLMWPKIMNSAIDRTSGLTGYRFYIRKKDLEIPDRTLSWRECSQELNAIETFLTSFLQQVTCNKEYSDLCNLPDLNERTLLDNVKSRFQNSNIYTYVGSILIAVNPFKFFPIYNPKYVKMYQNKRLGELPPHIFAIADTAFFTMLRKRKNQCIVISGESGSGKTETNNLLLHHLTALSQKGAHGSGVEQTILGAGPVLEAFGNAKTVHNNNSSRFGKFVQVNYKENGMVHGAIVEKYLLEKSRIVSQAKNERNYHVFYYLLAGSDEEERETLHLLEPQDYTYLKQSECFILDGLEEERVDEKYEFERLKQSMEMVGFSTVTQKRIFSVLSAVLLLGNVEFKKKGDQHHDESVTVKTESVVQIISSLLKVKEKTLVDALTQKRATAGDETVFMNYKMEDAIATRDAMAKCLYGALFDWIVLKVNQALLAKRHHSDHQGNSIGVLDIFGFEDFTKNSFEQFCINYANEHLQYYFNQHIFKFEQEEYKKEGIQWKNIEFIDNTGCLELFSKRGTGLFPLLDEECNFPGATNTSLLTKFNHHNKSYTYYQVPQLKEEAFFIVHYAGKVKYQIKDFREKNGDQIRPEIVSVLKSSSLTFVREVMGIDPVALLRWSIIRTLIRSVFAFTAAGDNYRTSNSRCCCKSPRLRINTNSQRRGSDYSLPDSLIPSENLLRKNKSFRPKSKPPTMLSDIKTLKDIASRTMYGSGRDPSRKQKSSVSAQFQWSLNRLMSTLQQANPFFIRCIKSNADKLPCTFDDVLVLRQLRYTGMLATVKIRQSGYNHRLTFDEFIQMYKILLPKGLLSSKDDVKDFLEHMKFMEENYQIGITKVFLRETEKQRLDQALHVAIMERVIRVQRWFKTIFERRNYVKMRACIIVIQACVRMFLGKRKKLRLKQNISALCIQRYMKGWHHRYTFLKTLSATLIIQCWYRGYKSRKIYRKLLLEKQLEEEKAKQAQIDDLRSSNSDEGILTKGSSGEELDDIGRSPRRDSSSSGVHDEDSESETVSLESKSRDGSIVTPPPTPTDVKIIVQPTIKIEADEYLRQDKRSSRVQDLARLHEAKADALKENSDTVSLERGPMKKKPKVIPAPLAKQESFSDLEPTSPSDQYVTSEKKRMVEEALKKPPHLKDQLDAESPSSTFSYTSPLRKAKIFKHNRLKNLLGDIKESTQTCRRSSFRFLHRDKSKKPNREDSDEDQSPTNTDRRPPFGLIGGIPVLPGLRPDQLSPTSPKSPTDAKYFPGVKNLSQEDIHDKKKTPKRGSSRREKDQNDTPKRGESPARDVKFGEKTEWQYPSDLVITDYRELAALDDFILKKLIDYSKELSKNKQSESVFDDVFMRSMSEFHLEMQATLSVEKQKGNIDIPYRDLLQKFAQMLEATLKNRHTKGTFPITMGVNAFRGFLDEFIKHKRKERKDDQVPKKIRRRDRAKKDIYEVMGHKFMLVQFGIPTFCEYCSNLLWIMEKGSVCQVCKYTCHKKCVNKTTTKCKGVQDNQIHGSSRPFILPPIMGPRGRSLFRHHHKFAGTRVFGVQLSSLVSKDRKVPVVVERLITVIELHGLYVEGLYRRAGAQAKVKVLKQLIDSGKEDLVAIDTTEYQIHVLAAVLKGFFRDLPEPVLTYDLYDDFIRAAEIHDEKERMQSLYAVIDKLPRPNHDLFERIIFHLARVAHHEDVNRMSVNGLAIIFAPTFLRTNKKLQAQESLNQVPKQTIVIEKIISEQLDKLRSTLEDLQTLESAEITAVDRLQVVRTSMRISKSPTRERAVSPMIPDVPVTEEEEEEVEISTDVEEEEKALKSHLRSIRKEKQNLTSKLPALECRHLSSDDDINSTDDVDSTYDTADDFDESEEFAMTFEHPVSPPKQLEHLTKRRASVPSAKRLPTKYQAILDKQSDEEALCKQSENINSNDLCDSSGQLNTLTNCQSACEMTHSILLPTSMESSYVALPARTLDDDDDDEIMV